MNELKRLKELADQLPKGLRADWRGTNHFELTPSGQDYRWVNLLDWAADTGHDATRCIACRRVGLLLDLAEEVSRLKPVLDALVDCGVIPNDSKKHVEPGGIEQKAQRKRPGWSELVVRLEVI